MQYNKEVKEKRLEDECSRCNVHAESTGANDGRDNKK